MATVMKFDTLSWAKKLKKAGVPSQQAELQVALVLQAIDDNTCTKQDILTSEGRIEVKLKEIELNIKEVETNLELKIKDVESNLELKIKNAESRLELKIKDVESKLELKIAEVKKDLMLAIEKVKATINTQIAKWVLGVSVVQTTVLAILIRSIH
jgi:copper chaperone CopZ